MSEYVTKIIQRTGFDWLDEKDGPVTPHWARHFFVNHSVIDLGLPIEVVQKTVGHSDKRVTEGYLDQHIDKKNDASWHWNENMFRIDIRENS
ncbi:tyrosine-type recombinase/integrase [bacterium LRH843]|nr:tyrosine-type recombinase/integrase [bacterium LRH843]